MNSAGITWLFCGGSEMQPLRSGFRTRASTLAPALGHPQPFPTPLLTRDPPQPDPPSASVHPPGQPAKSGLGLVQFPQHVPGPAGPTPGPRAGALGDSPGLALWAPRRRRLCSSSWWVRVGLAPAIRRTVASCRNTWGGAVETQSSPGVLSRVPQYV